MSDRESSECCLCCVLCVRLLPGEFGRGLLQAWLLGMISNVFGIGRRLKCGCIVPLCSAPYSSMSKPTAEQLAAIKAEFDKFDLNHDGSIDMPELGQVLRGLGPLAVMFRQADTDGDGVVSDAEVSALFKKADTDGNGVITFDEFVVLSTST